VIRDAVGAQRYDDIIRAIRYTVTLSYYEAFSWIMGILEDNCQRMDGFECSVGKFIPDYDEFVTRLGVDLSACGNDVNPVADENGEIQAFFNIITYKTAYQHINMVTSENFDARDNDYIEYRLVCSGN
jgi:hypothetical protein